MRLIGNISEEAPTKSFVAFLLTKNIDAVAEKVSGEAGVRSDSSAQLWAIWIKEEDDLPKAKKHFEDFQQDPNNSRYEKAVEEANRLMKETYAKQERNRDKVIVMRGRWNSPASQRKPLTVTIMVISIAVFLMTSGWQYGNFRNRLKSVEPSVVLTALAG